MFERIHYYTQFFLFFYEFDLEVTFIVNLLLWQLITFLLMGTSSTYTIVAWVVRCQLSQPIAFTLGWLVCGWTSLVKKLSINNVRASEMKWQNGKIRFAIERGNHRVWLGRQGAQTVRGLHSKRLTKSEKKETNIFYERSLEHTNKSWQWERTCTVGDLILH